MKAIVFLRLERGSFDEPDVTNEELLESIFDGGLFLRALQCPRFIEVLGSSNASEMEKLSALCALYQLLGAATEDMVCALILLWVWAHDRNACLADCMARISISTSEKQTTVPAATAAGLIAGSKRVLINPTKFFAALSDADPGELVHKFGLNWRKTPSIKLTGRDPLLQAYWEKLPAFTSSLVTMIASGKGELITLAYNKIKHGPQVLLTDSPIVAAKRRGLDPTATLNADGSAEKRKYLRLLNRGARRQEPPIVDNQDRRTAPFVVWDSGELNILFFDQLLNQLILVRMLGAFVCNDYYKRMLIPLRPTDAGINKLLIGVQRFAARQRTGNETPQTLR